MSYNNNIHYNLNNQIKKGLFLVDYMGVIYSTQSAEGGKKRFITEGVKES